MKIEIPYAGGHGLLAVALPGPYRTLAEIKRANAKVGHYFEPATMRFFLSRISDRLTLGRFFIDSIQFVSSQGVTAKRSYKVCVAADNGDVETVAFPLADLPPDLDFVLNAFDPAGYREAFASLRDARRTLHRFLKAKGVK